jgi:hypothetical protein
MVMGWEGDVSFMALIPILLNLHAKKGGRETPTANSLRLMLTSSGKNSS